MEAEKIVLKEKRNVSACEKKPLREPWNAVLFFRLMIP